METSNPKVDSLSESLLAFRFPTDETTVRNYYRKQMVLEFSFSDNTLLFNQIEPLKNGPFLFLPSSLSRHPKQICIIFQFLGGIVEGRTNRA